MAEKRDYYEVLGVEKNASADEIKKRIVKKRYNFTQTRTLVTNKQKKNSKRQLRLMKYYLILKRNNVMTSLDMQALVELLVDTACQWRIFSHNSEISLAALDLTSETFLVEEEVHVRKE